MAADNNPPIALPDFSGNTGFHEIQKQFVTTARSLMGDFVIQSYQRHWRITAVELYLFTKSSIWQDIYTHKTDAQTKSGIWYVHKRGSGFRAPNRSGIDVCCGRNGTYAGILLRQVCGEKGPATALKKFVRNTPYFFDRRDKWSTSEKDYIGNIDGQDVFTCSNLAFVHSPIESLRVWVGPRVGLSKARRISTSSEGLSFYDACLRVSSWKMDSNMKEWNDRV